MDSNLIFLFVAAVVVWLAVFAYLLSLSGRIAALRRELGTLDAEQGRPSTASDDGGRAEGSSAERP